MVPYTWPKVIAFILLLASLGAVAFKLGESLFASQELREPAALVRSLSDFSSLSNERFSHRVREYLLETVKIERQANVLILKAGHFLGPNSAVSACNTYKTVEYELSADGVANSGEPPQLYLSTDCEPTNDQESFEPIQVDIRNLVNLKPSDQVVDLNRRVKLEIKNFPDFWPNEWVLTRVRLIGDKSEFTLTSEDLRTLSLPARSTSW